MEQNQAQVCEISFNRFRELTYHKRVYFYFRKYADEAIKEFQADKEFGENFHDAVMQAIETIIQRTHLSKQEAKILSTELAAKMVELVESKQNKAKEMKW